MTPEPAAIALVAALLFVKEAGLPVPVPGDLLVLGAGVAAATGATQPVLAAVLLVGATVVGGAVQFFLLAGPGRATILRLLARFGLDEGRIGRRAAAVGRGPRAVAVARMTPGVRVLAIPAFALAGVPRRDFIVGLAVGNAVFVGAHFALGFALGEPAVTFASRALGPAAVVGLALAVLGAAGWWLLARRRRAAVPAPALDWADAACPACLAIAVVRVRAAGRPAEAA